MTIKVNIQNSTLLNNKLDCEEDSIVKKDGNDHLGVSLTINDKSHTNKLNTIGNYLIYLHQDQGLLILIIMLGFSY